MLVECLKILDVGNITTQMFGPIAQYIETTLYISFFFLQLHKYLNGLKYPSTLLLFPSNSCVAQPFPLIVLFFQISPMFNVLLFNSNICASLAFFVLFFFLPHPSFVFSFSLLIFVPPKRLEDNHCKDKENHHKDNHQVP